MGYPVSFFQIQGADGAQLVSFYKEAFGWQGGPSPDGGFLVAPEDGGIAGGVGPSRDGGSHLAIYVTVPSVEKHLEVVKNAGAQVVMEETELPGDMGAIGGFVDPAGNWVGLWHASATNPNPQVKVKKASKKKTSKKKASKKKASKRKTSKKKTSKKKASKKKASKKKASKKKASKKRG